MIIQRESLLDMGGFGYADRNDWLIQHRQNLVSSLLKEVNTFAGLQRRSVEYVGTEM